MAKKFTDVYSQARQVVSSQKFAEPDWEKFLKTELSVTSLLAAGGFDPAHAEAPGKIRKKLREEAGRGPKRIKIGNVIGDAAQNPKSSGKWSERAATLKMLRHLYRAKKRGGQDVWVYSPPRKYSKWIFDELTGSDKEIEAKLEPEREIFTEAERKHMCDALSVALKIAEDTKTKLSAKSDATKGVVKRWFLDEKCGDSEIEDALNKLNAGFNKISIACNSTRLLFTDYPDWRASRNKYYGGAFRGGEGGGFPVVYLEGAFTRLKGNTGKLWLCALTIIHELSHHEVSTEDHKYDHEGLKPTESGFPYGKAIANADSWGYFATDLAGYLSEADRLNTWK